MIDIDFPSIPTAGDQFSFTCRATVPERLVYGPSGFTISYDLGADMIVAEDNPDATQSPLTRNGNEFSRNITLNPVKTSDARNYFCIVQFDFFFIIRPNSRMLRVTSKSFVYIIIFHIFYISSSPPQYPLLTCHLFYLIMILHVYMKVLLSTSHVLLHYPV